MMSIGFIGCGKIAQSLMKGLISAKITTPDKILASAPKEDVQSHENAKALYCKTTYNNDEVVKNSQTVILATKPHVIPKVLQEIKSHFTADQLFISVALGIPISYYEKILPAESRVIRVMCNTPVLIRAGATVFCCGDSVLKSDAAYVKKLFTSIGTCDETQEQLVDAVTALSGSGPAYMYIFLEALADAGVAQGIPRELSRKLIAQTMLGSAKMVLETGKHTASLKDDVCSPAGCSIAAIHHFEKAGLRATVMDAVSIATEVAKMKSKTNGNGNGNGK